MPVSSIFSCRHAGLCAALVFLSCLRVLAQTSAFSYQGHLMDSGVSANGLYEIRFTLKNSLIDGSNVAPPQILPSVSVVNGLFSETVDFGAAAFDGGERWLEISVKPAGASGAYTILTPRQKVNAAPYSLKALKADTASTATSASNLAGVLTQANVPAALISSVMIADGAVGSAQIGIAAVKASNIDEGAINSSHMGSHAITPDKLRLGVDTGTLAGGALTVGGGVLSFACTFSHPYVSPPSVSIHPGSWTLGTVTNNSFSASIPLVPEVIDETAGMPYETDIVILNGRPAVAFAKGTDLFFARSLDSAGNEWSAPVLVDGLGNVGRYCSLAVVQGRPAISYYDVANEQLLYVISSDPEGAAWSAPVVVDASANVGLFSSLAVVNDRPAISYHDATNRDLKFVRAANANGTSWNTPVLVDAAGETGLYTSLLMVNARPAISYYEQVSGDLKFARASTLNGTAWDPPVVVDEPGDTGIFTSLNIIAGAPAISYYDVTNADLRFVRAENANGTVWAAPVTLDGAGISAGSYSSLGTLGGRAVVAYRESSVGSLKIVFARDETGVNWSPGVMLDSVGAAGSHISLVENSGTVCVSYTAATGNEVRHVSFLDLNWSSTDGTVTPLVASNVAAGAIASAQIAQGGIVSSNIAAGAVGASQIAPGAVGFGSLAKPPQSGVLENADIQMDFGFARFTGSFPHPYPGVPVVTSTVVPGPGLPDDASSRIISASGAGFVGKISPVAPEIYKPDNSGVVNIGHTPALGFIAGKPAMVSSSGLQSRLMTYYSALDARGTQWARHEVRTSSSSLYTYCVAFSLREIEGKPAIAFIQYDASNNQYVVKFVRALNAKGAAWADAVTVTLAADYSDTLFLEIMNHCPVISYRSPSGLKVVRALDSAGSAWGLPVEVDSGNPVSNVFNMIQIGGQLMLAYQTGSELRFTRSTNVDGTAWSPSEVIATMLARDGLMGLVICDGSPAVCHALSDQNVVFLRAFNAQGTAWGAASALPSGASGEGVTYRGRLSVVFGKPALISGFDDEMKYTAAQDAVGSTWNAPISFLKGSRSIMYSPLELLAGFPQMVFQTYTEENGNDGVYDLSSLTFPDLSGTKVNWIALPP